MPVAATFCAYSLAAYLAVTDIQRATIYVQNEAPLILDEPVNEVTRSAAGQANWPVSVPNISFHNGTAISEFVPIVIGDPLPNSSVVAQLTALRELGDGWDGEQAVAPNGDAIRNAVRFLQAAGSLAKGLDSAPHTDGSILLEFGDGSDGCLAFSDQTSVSYSLAGQLPGAADFDGITVPEPIRKALADWLVSSSS